MKTGVYVRAKRPSGKWDSVDVLELEEESFRRFVAIVLAKAGAVTAASQELKLAEAEPLCARAEGKPDDQ